MQVTLSNKQIVNLREMTTGDIFDATDAAKSIHIVPKVGPMFVVDQILLERYLLLKTIVDVDGNPELATIAWLRDLSPSDWEKVQNMNLDIDAATLVEVGDRGRDPAVSK